MCLHAHTTPTRVEQLGAIWGENCRTCKMQSENLFSLIEAEALFQVMWCYCDTFKIAYWFDRSVYNCVQSQPGSSNRFNSNQFASIKLKNKIQSYTWPSFRGRCRENQTFTPIHIYLSLIKCCSSETSTHLIHRTPTLFWSNTFLQFYYGKKAA